MRTASDTSAAYSGRSSTMHTGHKASRTNGVPALRSYDERYRGRSRHSPSPQRQNTVGPGSGPQKPSVQDTFDKIDAYTKHYQVRPRAGTLRNYLPIVLAQPKLAPLH